MKYLTEIRFTRQKCVYKETRNLQSFMGLVQLKVAFTRRLELSKMANFILKTTVNFNNLVIRESICDLNFCLSNAKIFYTFFIFFCYFLFFLSFGKALLETIRVDNQSFRSIL